MKHKIQYILLIIAGSIPSVTLAQGNAQNINSLIQFLSRIITRQVIPLFILSALAFTIYSVVKFIAADENSQSKEEMKQQIFWGIIGLFVIVSIWGLVAVVGNTFGIFAGGTLRVK